jgi:GNAT superfamily N-acetyltransferase
MVRDLRLRSLAEDPSSFGSSLAREQGYSEQRWRDWVTGRARGGGAFAMLIAFLDEQPVGLAVSCPDATRDSTFQLFAMWVAPEARHRGVARGLLAAAEEWVLEHGADAMELGVTTAARGAQALYAAAGYAPTGYRTPLDHLPGLFEVGLRKELRAG